MSEGGVHSSDFGPARKLADLQSILDDLRLVVTRCEIMQRTDLEPCVLEAVWEALVVAYYRSFATGKSGHGSSARRRLHAGHIDRLADEHQRTHALVTAERHRQVAHRDDRDHDLASEGDLTPVAVRSLACSLIVGLERMAFVEETRLLALRTKRGAD